MGIFFLFLYYAPMGVYLIGTGLATGKQPYRCCRCRRMGNGKEMEGKLSRGNRLIRRAGEGGFVGNSQ